MKLALIGPGYGHNIKPYLDYLEKDSSLSTVFYYHSKNDLIKDYKRIECVEFKKSFFQLWFSANKFDVIWLMGGGRLIYPLAIVNLFRRKKTHSILNIWSEDLPRKIARKDLRFFALRQAMNTFSLILCNWYGTEALIKDIFPNKVVTKPLGLSVDYFLDLRLDLVDNLEKQLNIIDTKEYKFFYPKSFTNSSRHDLIVEAAKVLLESYLIEDFKVYFLDGNVVDAKRKRDISDMIKNYGLEDRILLLQPSTYLDVCEMKALWSKMDCGLQIAEFDQLSHTIMEPIVNEKDIIISDIPPYHYIESYFGFKLDLTPLNVINIAEKMRNVVLGNSRISDEVKKNRIKNIKLRYSFEANLRILLDELHS